MRRKYLNLSIAGATLATFALVVIVSLHKFSAPPLPKEPVTVNLPPANIQTSKWETCRNQKAGYEFRYPKGWFAYGDKAWSTETPILIATTTCNGFSVWVLDQPPPI